MHPLSDDLVQMLPRLRRYARVLTGDGASGDDLVVRALGHARSELHPPALVEVMAIVHTLHRSGPVGRGGLRRRLERMLHVRRAETGSPLTRRLAALPVDERAVLALVAVEGLPYTDAAEVLDVPPATAMALLARARAHLRDAPPVALDRAS